ncbi:hypothetical protein [Variovorax sp. NFACC29]|uniref:hypothetical protein n=2 Tax=Variovorax TaxID=34072 RepID=UPI00347BB5EB
MWHHRRLRTTALPAGVAGLAAAGLSHRLEEVKMSAAMFAALFFTVALLVTTAYFIMGSIPLLVLKHDTPLDARFVRGFFNIYYVAAFVTASATALSFATAGRLWIAAGAAVLAAISVVLRRKVIPKMDALGAQIQSNYMDAIPGFRRTHVIAILINIAQLAAIVWCLIAVGK